MSYIPQRKAKLPEDPKRFYVMATTRVHADMLKEAAARGTDLYTLGGAVLTAWLAAGCPDLGFGQPEQPDETPSEQPTAESPLSPPPSSSPLAHDQGAGQ